MTTLHRWNRVWTQLGASQPDEKLFRDLVARYGEPQRSYHTLRHLEECLDHFDAVTHLASHPAEVELALWFHDSIYDVRATDNEERSADWARTGAAAAGLSADSCDRIYNLVLVTKNHTSTATNDEALLIDIDLSILGAAPTRYDEYDRAIREEYSWVPGPIFNVKRRSVLNRFLEQPRIFKTAYFAERCEKQARLNLQRSLDR